MPAFAQETTTSTDLLFIKHAIMTLDESAANGIITEAQATQGTEMYLARATKIAGRDIQLTEILALSDLSPSSTESRKLTRLQKFAGFITFVNIIWIFAILIGVVSVIWLLGSWIKALITLLTNIPLVVYEILCYVASIALIVSAHWLSAEVQPFVALTGCLFFGGALMFTANNHNWQKSPSQLLAILFVAWSLAATFYESSLIGFFAIIALMGAVGFSVVVKPLCYMIGFDDEDSLGRATAASFVLLILFVLLRTFGQNIPHVSVFESGSLFMGSFVGYLGLLISASRFYLYPGENYVLRQIAPIVAGVFALFVGTVWNIPELQKIGGTFFSLYIIEKFVDIPVEKVRNYAYIGLFLSSLIYGFCMLVKQNPDAWRPYLPF